MGTTYSVKVVSSEEVSLNESGLQRIADTELERVNRQMSTYLADSELSLWNRASTSDWQKVSPALFEVLQLSAGISARSSGAFDVTVMPLVNLWGFGPDERQSPPSDLDIREALKRVGYNQIEFNETELTVRKPAEVFVDLSAIAKGYAVDKVAQALQDKGVANFMVEVGGELYLEGVNRRGKPWRIGVETPTYDLLKAPQGPALAVDLSGRALATSGDYRNYYEVDGVRLSHTIDPFTGRPITHKLASVSVIADTCAEADGWATALNVLGPEKGMAVAERERLAVYMIIRDGDEFVSRATKQFEAYLVD